MSFNAAGLVQRRVRDSLILGIRAAFGPTHSKYPYIETVDGEFDFDNSKIFISDVAPIETVKYPYIVVDTLASEEQRYLGPDEYGVTVDPSGDFPVATNTTNFTSVPLTASIKIFTRDPITRDELMAGIYDALKINREQLATDGVEVITSKWAPDSKEFIGDRWWRTSTFTMDLYAEWSTTTAVTETVEGVNITEIEI